MPNPGPPPDADVPPPHLHREGYARGVSITWLAVFLGLIAYGVYGAVHYRRAAAAPDARTHSHPAQAPR